MVSVSPSATVFSRACPPAVYSTFNFLAVPSAGSPKFSLVASTVTMVRHRNAHRRAGTVARIVDEAEPGTELGVA